MAKGLGKGLGKGINAFFPELEVKDEESVQEINIKDLRANPYQPRKHFSKESLEELKQSILTHGILQPIIARKSIKGYEIVAGERRFRAAKEADLQAVPVVVRTFTEQQMMELALLENLQREDLTPIEEASAYQMLIEQLQITQEQLAGRLGKSRPHIANYMRLLSLPKEVQEMITNNEISMGHGRALLGLKDAEKIILLAKKIIKENLNVRQTEILMNEINGNVSRETKQKKTEKNVFYRHYEEELTGQFGTSVKIMENNHKGKIEIKFHNEEDLQRILTMLSNEK